MNNSSIRQPLSEVLRKHAALDTFNLVSENFVTLFIEL